MHNKNFEQKSSHVEKIHSGFQLIYSKPDSFIAKLICCLVIDRTDD